MATSSTFKYEVNLHPPKGMNLRELYSDVSYAVFIRNPPVRLGSFAIVRVNLPMVIIQQIQNDINDSNFDLKYHWNFDLWQIDESQGRKTRKFKLLFRKPMVILGCKIYQTQDMPVAPRHHVLLTMCNPLIYHLSVTTGYNKILQNITALDAIKDYESSLVSKYGDTFKFNRIGPKLKPNSHKYEQILVPTSVDTLHVPEYLIHTYKPYDSFSYYFFDDFHFQSDANRSIVCHHINLYDRSVFKKFDITRYADSSQLVHELGRFDLNDVGLKATKTLEDTTSAFKDREITTKDFKRVKSKVLKHKTASGILDALVEGRSVSAVYKVETQKSTVQESSDVLKPYVPDDITKSEARLITIKETIQKKIDRVFYFESINAMIDFPTYGKVYNMELDNQTSYTYTPLAIYNIFSRVAEKDEVLVHNPRFSMIRFYEEADAAAEYQEKQAENIYISLETFDQPKTKKQKTITIKEKDTKKVVPDQPGVLTTNKPEIITTASDNIIMPQSNVAGYHNDYDKTTGMAELWRMHTGTGPEHFEYASEAQITDFKAIVSERSKRQAVIKKASKSRSYRPASNARIQAQLRKGKLD